MLILAMSFSGSAVFLAILLSAVFGKKLVSSGWIYNMLKTDLVFFCLPLPICNSGYRSFVLELLGISGLRTTIDYAAENIIGIEESGRVYFSFHTHIIAIWAIWVCGLLYAFVKDMQKYHRVKAQRVSLQVNRTNYLEIFDRIKKELGIKKGVTLLCADDAGTICTVGMFRKYVIVPEMGLTDEEIYYSLKHELIHVKRSDVAWRYVGMLAVLMHWFNPLAYLYFYVMSVYCEQSCDTVLTRNLDKRERKRYGELIINMSQDEKSSKWKYRTYLSGSKKIIEWRLLNMLKDRKCKKAEVVMSLLLGAVILFGGSLTVCAYENPRVVEGMDKQEVYMLKDLHLKAEFINSEEIQFSEEKVLDKIEFIGDDGECYDLSGIEEHAEIRAVCVHSYVSGYQKIHHKNSDGSCRTDCYYANLCTKCGHVEVKGYSHTETSTKCIH
ncbi:MAG: M56 family metallopeptidase [Lachnospiraceae bacterium]|nr:M56 family metallopeptidase [Lachnospiraceae bacterium]